jgi:hypothetical protein
VVRHGIVSSNALSDELKAHVKSLLAPYKYPRWVEFVAELPKQRLARSSALSCVRSTRVAKFERMPVAIPYVIPCRPRFSASSQRRIWSWDT